MGYITPAGNKVVQEWIDELPRDVRDEFLGIMKRLRNIPNPIGWISPEFKKLKYEDGLYEFRFKILGKTPARPLGIFESGSREFIILLGATKKAPNWTPREALAIARRRRDEVRNGKAKLHEIDLNQR